MPAFRKPRFRYTYRVESQIRALRAHKARRQIPSKAPNRLLMATWNIANFGVQQRRDGDKRLIAEIVSWFDIVAVQEVRDNFKDLEDVQQRLGGTYHVLFSDTAGNHERMAFIYDGAKVTLLEKIGEVSIPPSDLRFITLEGVKQSFVGFDRNPYLATFQIGGSRSLLALNVHLYFGSESKKDIDRRALETYALGRWAALRVKSKYSFTNEIVALGDFNMPKRDPQDPIYKALTRRGLELPEHTSQVGSNLTSDRHYDQIAFVPGRTKRRFRQIGVFDFDMAVFKHLWNDPRRSEADFRTYVRYYLSDHRPLWMELAS